MLDVEYGMFSCIWANNPETDLAMPEIIRDSKYGVQFEVEDYQQVIVPTKEGILAWPTTSW